MSTISLPAAEPTRADRTRNERITKTLLGFGIIAGPCYVIVSLTQALIRPGFDLTRHAWSQLATGPYGWIQMANLVLTGVMVIAFAAGIRRAVHSRWASRLLTLFGLGMIGAGLLVADPITATPSWHGLGHLISGAVGFTGAVAAAFVLARVYARQGRRGLAWWSWVTAVVFAVAFLGITGGSSSPEIVLPFVASVIALFAWVTGVAVHHLRTFSAPS